MNLEWLTGRDIVIGSMFTGYGGLDDATTSELLAHGARSVRVAWVADLDPGASRILAHRYPGVPNLGDITAVEWAAVEPVDVVTGGFPCQDVSLAGARAGLRPDTRSGLWSQMAYAVSILRPNLMIAENVRGLLSGSAHSDVEPCPWCLGDTDVEPPVRAFGAVLADLADIGYDAQWLGLRASDVGAPHARFRVFVAAAPAYADGERHGDNQSRRHAPEVTTDPRDRSTATDSDDIGSDRPGVHGPSQRWRPEPADGGRRATVVADSQGDGRDEGWPEPTRVVGGPDAPVCSDAPSPDTDGAGHGSVGRVETGLRDADGRDRQDADGHPGEPETRWGPYGPAITRWAHVVGRPAPDPTTNGRLSPQFVEWMMGLDDGHVTDVPGLTRNDMLRALGNGVVPQQAAHALRVLLSAGRAS